jgi:hypothetical protein
MIVKRALNQHWHLMGREIREVEVIRVKRLKSLGQNAIVRSA